MKLFNTYILIFSFFMLCCQSVDRKIDTWNKRLCCNEEYSKLELDNFILNKRKTIEFTLCDNINNVGRLNLGLTKKENNKYNEIFDLISNYKMTGIIRINLGTPPKGFKGDFLNITELENGEYRLYLSNGISCGEVKFKLSQSGYRREFMCINNCSN